MSLNPEQIRVSFAPRFKRDLKQLAKRYRSIQRDLQPLIMELQAGIIPGEQIQGLNYSVFKVRLKNSDIQKGKSGGYRVIYYLQTQTGIVLLTLYSKSDKSNESNQIIDEVIRQLKE